MDQELSKLMNNPYVKFLYYAVLLVLVVMIFHYSKKSEHYIGTGLPYSTGAITSGATQRFGTGFSSTDQGSTPSYSDLRHNSEYLTSSREPPVFWDISNMLADYQKVAQYNCADGSPPMPMTDSMGNTYFACTDGSTPVPAYSSPASTAAAHASTAAAHTSSVAASHPASSSKAEYFAPSVHAQEDILRQHLY